MKKICTFVAVFTLAICFTSCSVSSVNPSVSPAAPEETVAAPDSADSPAPSASSAPGQRTLTVFLGNLDFVKPKITMFTKQNPDIAINYVGVDSIDALAVEMMSGNAPDLMFSFSNYFIRNYKGYGERGLLTDFKTLMANDPDFDASLYISSVLKSTEDVDGAMYAFPFLFNYSGMVTVSSYAPASVISDFTSRTEITLDDMLRTYAELSDRDGFNLLNEFYAGVNINGIVRGYYFDLNTYFGKIYPSYINYADKTCDFTNPALIQTMKYMKMFQILNLSTLSTADINALYDITDDEAAAKRYPYFCWPGILSSYGQYFIQLDSDHFEHPIPLTDLNGNVLIDNWEFCVYNGSHNKDIAWELIKYLTSDDVQNTLVTFNANPVTVKAFSNVMKFSIDNNNLKWFLNYHGSVLTADPDEQTAVQKAVDAYTAINNMPMVDCNGQDYTLDGIVDTEFGKFLSNATTAEQAAANMQNQAELYLNE